MQKMVVWDFWRDFARARNFPSEMLSKVAAAAARLPSLRRRIDNWYRARYIRKVTNCQSENLAFLLGIPAIIVRIKITIFSSKKLF
jgi:hypothetical protein